MLSVLDDIREELKDRLKHLKDNNKLVEAQRLEQRTQFDLEMIKELGYCSGIENYSRYLSGRGPGEAPPTLFDYLPSNALLVIDESMSRCRKLAPCLRAIVPVKRTWLAMDFACHPP